MLKQINKREQGFTIIEVLIVLAIAGLIMLIVFLAVPALQRNSRDTQRRNDVSRALGVVQEVASNNNGQLSSVDSTAVQNALGTPAYYTTSSITVSTTAASSSGSNSDTTDTVTIWKGATCGSGTTAGKAIPGSSRQIAITYKIESSGGTLQCTNS